MDYIRRSILILFHMEWMVMNKLNERTVTIKCTEYQAMVIKDACEMYGRCQIGQFHQLAELIMGAGMSEPEEYHDFYATNRAEWRKLFDEAKKIQNILETFWRVDQMPHKPRRNREMVALDMWSVLDHRRDDGPCVMGSEPQIEVTYDEQKRR